MLKLRCNISKPDKSKFAVRSLTNPLADQLKFTVNVKNQQAAQVIIMDVSGRILTTDKQILSSGTNMFSYNTSAWANGIYLINILTSEKFNSVLKAVK